MAKGSKGHHGKRRAVAIGFDDVMMARINALEGRSFAHKVRMLIDEAFAGRDARALVREARQARLCPDQGVGVDQ